MPDVANGYFIHPADLVTRQAADGEPRRIALAGDVQVIAADFQTFLQRLEIAVEIFAATGHLADL